MTIDLNSCRTLEDFERLYPPRNLPDGAEVVRIAPSPTGMPHIGTAMQAGINRALADHVPGGIFILRIEDTDRARTIPGAIEAIMEGLDWLGCTPDEGVGQGGGYGPYIQSERLPIYQAAARHLVDHGHAYPCFCTAERLEALRDGQMKRGLTTRYDAKCHFIPVEEAQARAAAGEAHVIRFKSPETGKIDFTDEVRGRIEFDAKTVDDFIILKSDGFPPYHLAVIVDDRLMRVTTIVRGEEWISSTPKHVLLYQAFGWPMPKLLHTVLLRDEQKQKLSKRKGDTSIAWFRAEGYLPQGLRNFLSRVMWAHPDSLDIYPPAEFARLMRPADLPSTGPVVSMQLLGFINGKYLSALTPAQLRDTFCQYLEYLIAENRLPYAPEKPENPLVDVETAGKLLAEIRENPDYAERVFALEPERNQKLSDLPENYSFFFASLFRPASHEALAEICADRDLAKRILHDVANGYDPDATHEQWEAGMRALAAKHEQKDKTVFMLARVAVTGLRKTPPLYDIMRIAGSHRVIERCMRA